MPKYPNIKVKLKNKKDRFIIIITCLRAIGDNNIGYELDNFINEIGKYKYGYIMDGVRKWFKVE